MKTIKGPAIFLAQFAGDTAPFNSFDAICEWAASLGYKGVQIPAWDARLIDLKKASEFKDYCDELAGVAASHGLKITELSTHLQGQLVAVHPVYERLMDGFAAPEVHGNPKAAAGMGGATSSSVPPRFETSRPEGSCHLLRRARLAVPLSVSAASGRSGRSSLRRAGQALDADPQLSRRARRRCRLRNPSGRRPARRHHLRDVPRAGQKPSPRPTCSTTRPTSSCSSSTISTTSTSITSGSKPSTSRMPSSIRPGGRASMAASSLGSDRAGRFRSLGDGQVDFGARLLQADRL